MLKFGKQSPLKQEWKEFLKSSSLFVRNHVSTIVFPFPFVLYFMKRIGKLKSDIV
jgi:hypothetical protein